MSLDLQIKSLFISFLFGSFFSCFFNLNYRILFTKKKVIRLISNILFALIMSLSYFLLLKKMNEAILHPYYFFPFCLGFFIFFPKTKKFRKLQYWIFKHDK